MAVRLHMKLGVVAEHDRLPDSPDTVVVVEPSVGSVARSKGHLYLLVTSQVSTRHALEATRLTAETIRNEYYYDESAGIRVCLQKAIATANKRLAHQSDRLGLRSPGGNGPIGVGVAVVRGSEMYVATVGPAEAYLIRQARLSTLPDPHRERGLPSGELEPDVWRGEISFGDSLVLVSPNVVARLGPEELKDAMLTLHPQSAMEHLHHRFVAAEGSGSDGAIAFEATEVSATAHQRTLVPVRPAEPLAGAPDRSPIPLADNVQAAGDGRSCGLGQREDRGRWCVRTGRRPGPGPPAQATAGIPAGDAAGIAARDAAPRGRGAPRVPRRLRWPGTGRVGVRSRWHRHAGDQLDRCRPAGARGDPRQPERGDRAGHRPGRGRTRAGQRAADGGLRAAVRGEPERDPGCDHRAAPGADDRRPRPAVRHGPGELDATCIRSSRRRASRRSI